VRGHARVKRAALRLQAQSRALSQTDSAGDDHTDDQTHNVIRREMCEILTENGDTGDKQNERQKEQTLCAERLSSQLLRDDPDDPDDHGYRYKHFQQGHTALLTVTSGVGSEKHAEMNLIRPPGIVNVPKAQCCRRELCFCASSAKSGPGRPGRAARHTRCRGRSPYGRHNVAVPVP
jgi:hypothetical protein